MKEKLACEACGHSVDALEDIKKGMAPVPVHCGKPMTIKSER